MTISNTEQAQKAPDERIKRINRMDAMLYDDKLAGLISTERYKAKHKSFIGESKDLQK